MGKHSLDLLHVAAATRLIGPRGLFASATPDPPWRSPRWRAPDRASRSLNDPRPVAQPCSRRFSPMRSEAPLPPCLVQLAARALYELCAGFRTEPSSAPPQLLRSSGRRSPRHLTPSRDRRYRRERRQCIRNLARALFAQRLEGALVWRPLGDRDAARTHNFDPRGGVRASLIHAMATPPGPLGNVSPAAPRPTATHQYSLLPFHS